MCPSGLWPHCSRCHQSCWLPDWRHPLPLLVVRWLWRWRHRVARPAGEPGQPERSPSCTERPAAKTSASPCRCNKHTEHYGIKPLQETTENPHTAVLDSSADHGAGGVLLNGSSIGPWIRLHGEVNSQSRLVDVGEDDVRCWYHLRETLHALLSRSNTGGGVRRALFTLWTMTCPHFPPTRFNVTFSESSWWSRCTCRGR